MTRIRARLGAGRNHAIVAGQLPLDPQAMGRPPHDRMEPVEGARDLGERLRQTVVAHDVREFVPQHGTAAVVAPRVGHRRHQDGRLARTKRDGHVQVTRAEERHRAPQSQIGCTLREHLAPLGVGECG